MDILKTNKSNCTDCHKCIKSCPVNAIKFADSQACIDIDRCILDGACHNKCPQHAKSIRNDLNKVKELLSSGKQVVASIAPSIFAYYDIPKIGKILAYLKKIGFSKIEQTSRASFSVALTHLKNSRIIQENMISSACPSVVYLIENYYPDLLFHLSPVDSPMVAHYKLLKKELQPPFEMVFIGPCIAKKKEMEGTGIAASLTFRELEALIDESDEDIDSLELIFFDDNYSGNLSLFPLEGELVRLAGFQEHFTQNDVITVSGIDKVQSLLDSIRNDGVRYKFIEAMACEGGCIMGPARPKHTENSNYYSLRKRLIDETSHFEDDKNYALIPEFDLFRNFTNNYKQTPNPTEEQMQEVLNSIGKYKREDELNCGSCGYDTCKEKAIAVINGMAEREMCLPFMKSRAESFSKIILESNPNGVIILNEKLQIKKINPAFIKISGMSKKELIGKDISIIFDDIRPFNEVLGGKKLHETTSVFKNRKIKKFIFSVPEDSVIIVFLIDITDVEIHKEALQKVKNETLENAQIVIEKQMKVAHDVAVILGETAADTEILLGKLINIIKQG